MMTARAMRRAMRVLATAATLAGSVALADNQSQGEPHLDYMLQCQGCHFEDGSGRPDLEIPSMTGLTERFPETRAGRAFLVQVPGVSQAPLDDRAIASLLNWILEHFPANAENQRFAPYSEEEVAEYRAEKLRDVGATRARLIQQRLESDARAR